MRRLMLVALFAVPFGCAHRSNAHNLAQRQSVTAPPGEIENGPRRDDSRDRAVHPVEPPIVTPPIP
jgi:hypothetical protein